MTQRQIFTTRIEMTENRAEIGNDGLFPIEWILSIVAINTVLMNNLEYHVFQVFQNRNNHLKNDRLFTI